MLHHIRRAAHSVPAQIQTRIGPRSQILLSYAWCYLPVQKVSLTKSQGKKLKKRLEDLERRAASSSASPSPEVKYVDLDLTNMSGFKGSSHISHIQESNNVDGRGYTSNGYDYPYSQAPDDKRMFSYQHTRQLSTSPPPLFSYQAYPSIEQGQFAASMSNYMSYPLAATSSCMVPSSTMAYQTSMPVTIKPEVYEEDDMNPFSLSYASMAGVDVTSQFSYQTPTIHTPALSDSFEHSKTSSPAYDYMTFPRTPLSLLMTPPLRVREGTR
ncbi:hypothetical protein E4T47_02790 [Aureobasidium subglaciale]|nr:hypothetical protein E4T47_02790 [Aureobasidium subglaciale]